MTDFKTLQDAHLQLLSRQDADPNNPAIVPDAQAYIAEVVGGSTWIADPGERDLLRAYLRYWAGVIYERTGAYPKTELRPAEQLASAAPSHTTTQGSSGTTTTPPRPARSGGLPAWLRLLGALLALLALGALAIIFLTRAGGQTAAETPEAAFPEPSTPLPPVTRTPLPETPEPATPIDQSNAAALQPLARADAHTGGALAVTFDPARPEIATAGADGVVRFWAWIAPDNLTLSRQLSVGGGALNTVDYSPAAPGALPALFLTGGNNRILSVFNAESLQLFADFVPSSPESGFIFAGRFSPDGALIASGHADGVTRIWNVRTGTESGNVSPGAPGESRLAQIPSGGAVRDVAFSPDGLYLAQASAAADIGFQVVDRSWSNVVCAARSGPALSVAYSPRGDRLAVGTEDGRLLLIAQTANGCQLIAEEDAHDGGVADVAFSPTGEWLVTVGTAAGGDDDDDRDGHAGGWMKLWTPDGDELAEMAVGAPPAAVAVAPNATVIATADLDGRLILWGIP